MGGSSSPSPQAVTQSTATKDPWSGAQPYLLNQMAQAQGYLAGGIGYLPYAGQTQAAMDPNLVQGLNNAAAVAITMPGGAPSTMNSLNLANQMLTAGGLAPGQVNSLTQLNRLATEAQGTTNPYLQNILDTQGQRIADRVNAGMSSRGRYGSGQHTDVMTRALAEAANPILAQDYNRRQALQQQLYGQISDIYGQGLANAGRWAQLAPSLEQARYAPSQMLAGIGEYYTNRNQATINDAIKYYNAWQAYPWEQLARANAIAQGAGGLGGTTVTSSPINQPSTTQRVFGGALTGAGLGGSLFGLPGAGIGAIGGSLLGLL